MNINRNNYEEFFLLYVDNELSAGEKNAVDVFLQDNPDLQEELLMLQQSVVKPDAVVFEDKQKLLVTAGITESIQEKLLLYLDGEANKNDTTFVQQLIRTDDAVKKEWTILQQTKLDAGTALIFKDKHLLYKKETGKVVGFRWWSVAAAAVLIGFGIWGAVTYSTKNTGAVEVVKNVPVKESSKHVETIVPKQNEPAVIVNAAPVAVNKEPQAEKNVENIQPQHNKQTVTPVAEKNIAAAQHKNKKPAAVDNTPGPRLEKLNNPESNNNDVANVTLQKTQSNTLKVETSVIESKKDLLTNNDFAFASVKEEIVEESPTEGMEEEERKGRTKVGGFFKKMKRMLERKTNTGNSDNSIKIANLSFAVQ